jgi:hypothetical protein
VRQDGKRSERNLRRRCPSPTCTIRIGKTVPEKALTIFGSWSVHSSWRHLPTTRDIYEPTVYDLGVLGEIVKHGVPPILINGQILSARCIRKLNRHLQILGGTECDFLACFDLNGFAGRRIAPHAGCALSDFEGSFPSNPCPTVEASLPVHASQGRSAREPPYLCIEVSFIYFLARNKRVDFDSVIALNCNRVEFIVFNKHVSAFRIFLVLGSCLTTQGFLPILIA